MGGDSNGHFEEHALVRPYEGAVGPASTPEGAHIVLDGLVRHLLFRPMRVYHRVWRQTLNIGLDVFEARIHVLTYFFL